MSKEEFNKGNYCQVRRNNIQGSRVRNVLGANPLEGLVLIEEYTMYGSTTWVRYENLDIITKKDE